MATRSIIARQLDDGTVRSIYVHWDGGLWPKGVGDALHTHFSGYDEAARLFEVGCGYYSGPDNAFSGWNANAGWDPMFYDCMADFLDDYEKPADYEGVEFVYVQQYGGDWYVKPRDPVLGPSGKQSIALGNMMWVRLPFALVAAREGLQAALSRCEELGETRNSPAWYRTCHFKTRRSA